MNLLKNQQAAETIDSVYIDLEAQLMQNIARHLANWNQAIDTDKWLMQKLAEIGKLNQENLKLIAQMSGISQTAAERMLNELAEETIKSLEPGFQYLVEQGLINTAVSPEKSKNVKQTMNKLKKQAKDSLNLTNTTMLHKAQEVFKNLAFEIADEAIRIMNNNTSAMITGAESRQQALRKAIRQFNDKGITGFVDKRGRNWTPEAYVNMCMRTTAGNVANEVQTARCEDYGINLISIDAHSGARPKCAKDQGKIFDLNNESGTTEDLHGKKIKYYPWSSSSYGEPDGLLGINCGHHKFPFVPGVNVQRYFPTDDLDANNKLYKQTQVQRALERDVRKQKRECMLFDELGDKDAFEESAVKLKAKEVKLRQYVDEHNFLHRRRDREQVVGFDKSISARAIEANNRSIRVASEQSQYREYLKSLKEGKVTLRNEQQKILDKVPDVENWIELRKKQVDVKDLAAFTAATGHEFAIFTGKNSKILVHGTSKSWHIPHEAWEIIKENQYEWTAHSHPTFTKLKESDEDIDTLSLFTWQDKSAIIDLEGKIHEFTSDRQAWFNKMLGVTEYDKPGKRTQYSWPETD